MSDIEIQLYYGDDLDPLTTVDGSYADFARLETRSIVTQAATAFESHVDEENPYRIVLDDRNRSTLHQDWIVPFDVDEETIRHALEQQISGIVRQWRSNSRD